MIRGYKCDFCDFFSPSYIIITDHEQGCYHNKKNKRCNSCRSYVNIGYEAGEDYWVCGREEEHENLNIEYSTAMYARGCILWEDKDE